VWVIRKEGVGLTGKVEIADGFCGFYSEVGPKLVAKISREKEGAFLDYIDDKSRGVALLEADDSTISVGVMWVPGSA
jgi:hypothetical protein